MLYYVYNNPSLYSCRMSILSIITWIRECTKFAKTSRKLILWTFPTLQKKKHRVELSR